MIDKKTFYPSMQAIIKECNFDLAEGGLNPGLPDDNLPLYHLSYTILCKCFCLFWRKKEKHQPKILKIHIFLGVYQCLGVTPKLC